MPTMFIIAPPNIKRETARQKLFQETDILSNGISQKKELELAPTTVCLRSRRSFYNTLISQYNE